MSEERTRLSIPQRKAQTRQMIADGDWVKLGSQNEFLRTLYTILKSCGMFTGNYQTEGRNHAYAEGRRSLGLDILRTAEKHLGPDALQLILEAEKTTPRETSDDRSGTDYDADRDAELGGDELVSDAEPVRYLDYGNDKPLAG